MRPALAAALLSAALGLPAAPAHAVIPGEVHADLFAFARQAGTDVFAVTVVCEAVSDVGAIATFVTCSVNDVATSYEAVPGNVAVATVQTSVAARPVVACVTGQGFFADGRSISTETICRQIVPG